MFKKLLYVFLLSMVPVIELRGAIPLAAALDVPLLYAIITCVIGNLIPVPFILFFIKPILELLKKIPFMVRFVEWIENKAMRQGDKLKKGAMVGLFFFVAIPLPGTGAWTGALVASLFDIKKRYSIPAITLGVIAAGILVSLISYGFLTALSWII